MSCKAIERLILESEERPLGDAERKAVDGHLRACPGCRAFRSGRRAIRDGLAGIRWAAPPPALVQGTRELCLEVMSPAPAGSSRRAAGAKVPLPVVVLSVLFALVAAVWLTATLADVTPGAELPWTAWVAIAFIAQNVLTLFFAPVILRAVRSPENQKALFS